MINVYDWFESFQTILETQRMESLSRTRSTKDDDDYNNNKRPKKRTRTRTPSPRKRGNKMKQGQTPAETEEGLERTPSPRKRGNKMKQQQQQAEVESEESLEQWKVEVNARFIRALHELDYLGFIKHTNRKGRADHVLRTLFDVADDEFDE